MSGLIVNLMTMCHEFPFGGMYAALSLEAMLKGEVISYCASNIACGH
eukprot:COSAG01_NODE_672_length_14331_cov_88.368092_9_plen_47_part_00